MRQKEELPTFDIWHPEKNTSRTKRRLCDEIVRSKRRERGRVKGSKGKGRNENIEIKKYSFEKIFTRERKKTTRG